MSSQAFGRVLIRLSGGSRGRQRRLRRTPVRCRPQLAALEARALLSTITVMNDNDSGSGSLRAALGSAVAGDTIKFAPSAYGTITLSSGPLEVATSVTIDGPGAGKVAINGNNTYQDLAVLANVTATISGLTITRALGPATYPYEGGGINNAGTLTVENCVVTGNSSPGGGGIGNSGNLTVTDCSVTNNTANYGAGIFNNGEDVVQISDSKIMNNSVSGLGGGIANEGAVTITGSLLTSNTAAQGGGAIQSFDAYGPAPLAISDSVVSNNTASGNSGGLLLQNDGGPASDLDTTITGTTFMNNVTGAQNPFGGAICVLGSANLTITGSLFQTNTAVAGQYIGPQGGAIAVILGSGGDLDIANSRFVGNSAVGSATFFGDSNGGAVYVSSPFNVQVTGSSFTDNSATGGFFVDGGALDLQNFGFDNSSTLSGDTFQGNMAVIDPTSTSAGSAEGGALVVVNPTTVSGCTFTGNQAIGGPGGGFGLGGAVQSMTYSGLDLTGCQFINNSAIGGPGSASMETGGYGGGGAVQIYSGWATVSDSTFIGNEAVGGTQVPGSYSFGGAWGGAILNNATLAVSDCTLSLNTSAGGAGTAGVAGSTGEGGAIMNFYTLTVTDCTITGNTAVGGANGGNGEGGGIGNHHNAAGSAAPLTVTSSTITGNAAIGGFEGGDGDGGGIYNTGTASLTNVYVAFNLAVGGSGGGEGVGGGLYVGGGSMTLLGTTQVVFNFATTSNDNIYGPYST
jgi:Right handed beta helix region